MPSSNLTSNHGPRVSHTTTKASPSSNGYYLFPSWMTVEVAGPRTFSGAGTQSGAQGFSGNVAVTGTLALGASGTSLSALRVSTFSMAAGTVAPQDSATTTATISLMPADAVIIGLQPASQWSGAYLDVDYYAQVSAASTLLVSFRNSTITSVAPALLNWTVAYVDPS